MKKIVIDVEEYDKLIMDSLKLHCLEKGGICNWSGYSIIMDEIKDWRQRLIKHILKEKVIIRKVHF